MKIVVGEDKNLHEKVYRFACTTKEERDHFIKAIKEHAPNCGK